MARRRGAQRWSRPIRGAARSPEEPYGKIQLRRAQEHGRGRNAVHPLQLPVDRMERYSLPQLRGSIIPIAYCTSQAVLRFSSCLTISSRRYRVGICHMPCLLRRYDDHQQLGHVARLSASQRAQLASRQANHIAAHSGGALSVGIIAGLLVSLWSAMSGVKAIIDALNVIYHKRKPGASSGLICWHWRLRSAALQHFCSRSPPWCYCPIVSSTLGSVAPPQA